MAAMEATTRLIPAPATRAARATAFPSSAAALVGAPKACRPGLGACGRTSQGYSTVKTSVSLGGERPAWGRTEKSMDVVASAWWRFWEGPDVSADSFFDGAADEGTKVELESVCKVFGDRRVVDGVSLHLEAGEVVGLLGPNGAGKTTTFNIVVGRVAPTEGSVKLIAAGSGVKGDGAAAAKSIDITALPMEKRARLGIGYLPQEASIFRGLSVADNIRLVLQETGVPKSQHEQRLKELLATFALENVADSLGRSLSGGERRRTEIARALAANCGGRPPRFLLVDEPFAGVDPIGVQEIQRLLRQLCEESKIGIFVTDHNVTETLRICDRAYMMLSGRVMAAGEPQALLQDKYVRENYLGEEYQRQPARA
eukprot:TRINITY_DN5571_c0_g1_i1.p1 TRINITY_DN5571_c0_g1~~TRINITY_DN5571_c0_g1_i1.p1  ORF type:complete len:370 (-),score=72.95 TRINITY_DN5571_c0_g1_i1:395-1504(-)